MVSPTADAATVRTAFRTLIRKWHPDCAQPGDADAELRDHAAALIEAYRTLSHPERRQQYDRRRIQISMASGTDRRRGERRQPVSRAQKALVRQYRLLWALSMSVAGGVALATFLPDLSVSNDVSRDVLRAL
ncbi:J domain-containing protein [Sphingomonas sp. ABOLG]|nr:J domain-containing protein [Sphingomonas sp. ABOLG]